MRAAVTLRTRLEQYEQLGSCSQMHVGLAGQAGREGQSACPYLRTPPTHSASYLRPNALRTDVRGPKLTCRSLGPEVN
jgi:hypothetical protein